MASSERGSRSSLADRLRLIVITDRTVAAPRPVEDVVAEALSAGAPAIQLRDKEAEPREVLEVARQLRALTRDHRALLFLNDRFDIALAAAADGVHLGPDDLPVASVREAVPPDFLIGYSADDPELARHAVADGADYIGCGAVYSTPSKADAGEVIGLDGLRRVVEAVEVPVVGIGGITPERAAEVYATHAAGCAVISAVMGAEDVGAVVRGLLTPPA